MFKNQKVRNQTIRKRLAIMLLISISTTSIFSQSNEYFKAFEELSEIIQGDCKNKSFRKAVWLVESTYNNRLEASQFQIDISLLKDLVAFNLMSKNLKYDKKDKDIIEKYGAIYTAIVDTVTLIHQKDTFTILPYRYDFDDVFGEKKWENMFVTKLLKTKKGNCHSLPYLYKILCDELGVPCWLALAPNHIYVKHRSEKAGMYNTELTSASFPIDAWIMASGYIKLEAIQNGIFMEALDDKKCIALCVLDLAKGYDKKYQDNDGAFITKCCDLTLEYFPNCINALLLKVETKKKQTERLMKQQSITNPIVLVTSEKSNK